MHRVFWYATKTLARKITTDFTLSHYCLSTQTLMITITHNFKVSVLANYHTEKELYQAQCAQ